MYQELIRNIRKIDWHGWWQFALVSLFFFHITAATFTSLGVALRYLIEEMYWSWSNAGIGFSILAFMVGIAGRLPSWTLRRFGSGATFGIGGVIMAIGFSLLATSADLYRYFLGAALAGLGYALCATVPGVAVIDRCLPQRRSFAIGAYMTIGGLGGVAGPLIVTGVVALTGSWRSHWWLMAATIMVLVFLALITFGISNTAARGANQSAAPSEEKRSDRVHATSRDWDLKDVLRTPQYYVIVAALTITLFAGVTTASWAVTHMGTLEVSITVAAGAMSAHALVNALSRVFGGALATRIDPKWLLASALVAGMVGMFALAVADNTASIVLFAFTEGYGFGMCFFATTMLLVNYYGPKEAPKTMGTMHMITTVAMLGPVLGGVIADTFGGFAGLFRGYAFVMLVCLIAVVLMQPPSFEEDVPEEG
jgi:OFA family oxalate/formate antiporter-like MFS transporter